MNSKNLQRILVVDDEADIQVVVKMALEMVGGFVVEVCSSGQEALKKIVTFQPDLILLDVMLPGMDGPSIFKELKNIEEIPPPRVIFLTAKIQTQDVELYNQLGVLGVLEKPFNPLSISSAIASIWNKQYE